MVIDAISTRLIGLQNVEEAERSPTATKTVVNEEPKIHRLLPVPEPNAVEESPLELFLAASGLDERIARFRSEQPALLPSEETSVLYLLKDRTAQELQEIRRRLLYAPPHPRLRELRGDPSLKGPATAEGIVSILAAESVSDFPSESARLTATLKLREQLGFPANITLDWEPALGQTDVFAALEEANLPTCPLEPKRVFFEVPDLRKEFERTLLERVITGEFRSWTAGMSIQPFADRGMLRLQNDCAGDFSLLGKPRIDINGNGWFEEFSIYFSDTPISDSLLDALQNLADRLRTNEERQSFCGDLGISRSQANALLERINSLLDTGRFPRAHNALKGEPIAYHEFEQPQPRLEDINQKDLHLTIAKGPLFGPSGPSIGEVNQGNVGMCHVSANLARFIKEDPSQIRDMIRDNNDGTFTVRFFEIINPRSEGKISDLEVRPVEIPVGRSFYTKGDPPQLMYGGNGALDANVPIWHALILKAYAKWKGNYDLASGGHPVFTTLELSGRHPQMFSSELISTLGIGGFLRHGHGTVVTEDWTGDRGTLDDRLMPSHAYAILNASSDGTLTLHDSSPNGHGTFEIHQDEIQKVPSHLVTSGD